MVELCKWLGCYCNNGYRGGGVGIDTSSLVQIYMWQRKGGDNFFQIFPPKKESRVKYHNQCDKGSGLSFFYK